MSLNKIIEKQVNRFGKEFPFGSFAGSCTRAGEVEKFLRQAIRQAVEEALGEVVVETPRLDYLPSDQHSVYELDMASYFGMGFESAKNQQVFNHKKLLSKGEKNENKD